MKGTNVLSDGTLEFVFGRDHVKVMARNIMKAMYLYTDHPRLQHIAHRAAHPTVGTSERILLGQTYETLMDEPLIQEYL